MIMAGEAWPDAVILCQLPNNAYFEPMRIDINFRSIFPIFLFSFYCHFDLLSGRRMTLMQVFQQIIRVKKIL